MASPYFVLVLSRFAAADHLIRLRTTTDLGSQVVLVLVLILVLVVTVAVVQVELLSRLGKRRGLIAVHMLQLPTPIAPGPHVTVDDVDVIRAGHGFADIETNPDG
ncbi:hypothetical protein Trco_004088 [Trichoderma cornu-damae]|uniref:Uncharacterized protein n=1 Tax=Trichoderma cornu-damae TaxID=654480 RepID=A0A9P8QK15_9HYPO|nr:hypothetical protein Trco_004088 [Trichoderma cornu-damae]